MRPVVLAPATMVLVCAAYSCGSTDAPVSPSPSGRNASSSSGNEPCTPDTGTSTGMPRETTDGTCSDLVPLPEQRRIVETQSTGEQPAGAGGEIPTGLYLQTGRSVVNPAQGEAARVLPQQTLYVTANRLFLAHGRGCEIVRQNFDYRASGSKLDGRYGCGSSFMPAPEGMPFSWEYTVKGDDLTIIQHSIGSSSYVDVYTRQDPNE